MFTISRRLSIFGFTHHNPGGWEESTSLEQLRAGALLKDTLPRDDASSEPL